MTLRTNELRTHVAPEALLESLGISEASEIDIEAIAQHCGATVLYAPLVGCEARLLGHGDRAFITVRSDVARGRQRFSAAHELGHWMGDRERVARACDEKALTREWTAENPERRANRYAAELLLPRSMFSRSAKGRPITFETARDLAGVYQTSLTATAIRLVELGSAPSMIVCSSRLGRRWFIKGPDVPALFPREQPLSYTTAAGMLTGGTVIEGPSEVCAEGWIDDPDSSRFSLVEDSIRISADLVLSLLWWKNEEQLIELLRTEDAED